MKCVDVQERFGEYWDLPENDIKRLQVDTHIRKCGACAAEFEIWRASAEWIQSARPPVDGPIAAGGSLSSGVMDRIYRDESWRLPLNERTYSISFRLRRGVSSLIGVFLVIFVVAAIHGILVNDHAEQHAADYSGIMPTANAEGGQTGTVGMFESIPVASISAPSVLSLEQFPHTPDYWIALSLIGVFSTLLIMNWLSRLRA